VTDTRGPTRSSPTPARTIGLTAATLVAFAANSILCRAALRPRLIDAASFTAVRLFSGAVVLVALSTMKRGARTGSAGGSWASAAALFAYAIAFSLAYLRIDAGIGALILFGSVQITMIGRATMEGRHPSRAEWIGLASSVLGLLVLTRPGVTAPDGIGAGLMALAGIAWGVYSLRGRGVARPLDASAQNFLRTLPAAAGAVAIAALLAPGTAHASRAGVLLAAVSGGVTSGLGYVLWYAALAGLTSASAAIVQLAVPVLAAAGGVVFLSETVTARLLLATPLVLGGVAIAIGGRRR
jgi:drug/metabolite transporter (DMT)-like permease